MRGTLDKAAHENFPVAPFFLPRARRDDLMAVYGFARLVDDIGDGDLAPGGADARCLGVADAQSGDRLALLDAFETDLRTLFPTKPDAPHGPGGSTDPGTGAAADPGTGATADPGAESVRGPAPGGPPGPRHPVLQRLAPTVRRCDLGIEPFLGLIGANRQDQLVGRYETYDELLAYCELSANPVGRLVLGVTGTTTPERTRWSDAVCTALQIVEHIQDVAEDLARDRIYVPAEDMERFHVRPEDLAAPVANASVRALIAFEAGRALDLLNEGTPLVGSVHGRLKLLLAGFVAGGRAAVRAVRAASYDVLSGPPKASRVQLLREVGATLRGKG